MAASRTSSAGRGAMGGGPTMSAASASVSTMSGEKVSLASRAPRAGMVPNGLTMTSPASRQTSAQAMTQDSARVTPVSLIGFGHRLGGGRVGSCRRPLRQAGPVLLVVHQDVALGEGLPLGGVGGRGGVLLLECLVAPVVGRVGGEVRATRRLGHAVDQQAVG